MKNIKQFEDFNSVPVNSVTEGENHHENYMFFQHLMTIKHAIEDMLAMDREKVDKMLSAGHDWALDHMATSTDDVEEVYHFLKGRMEMEDEEHEQGHDDHHENPMNVEIISDIETEDDDDDNDGEDE